jgi:hypothetical protein
LSRRDEYLFGVDHVISRHGFFVQYVLGDRDTPPWAYTIGFLQHGCPEAVVFGLGDVASSHVLHWLYGEFLAGRRPTSGREVPHWCDGVELRLEPVPVVYWCDPHNVFNTAVDYYAGIGVDPGTVDAVQLVWPDERGNFSWDEGFAAELVRRQPLLADERYEG